MFINYIIQRKAIKQPLSIKGRVELKKNDLRLINNITENIPPTEFLGYEQTQSECSIISLVCNNKSVNKLTKDQEAIIILNQTPFYGESGGQVGDSGKLNNDNLVFQVTNTTKIFGNYFLHWGKVIDGNCSTNDTDDCNICDLIFSSDITSTLLKFIFLTLSLIKSMF